MLSRSSQNEGFILIDIRTKNERLKQELIKGSIEITAFDI